MSAPKIAVVFYKYKTYANGTHPVMIRITANRKSSYLTTGYSIRPENWGQFAPELRGQFQAVNWGLFGRNFHD